MLCQFSFSNFRSYRDETTFDFQAAALSEFKDSLIKTEKGNDILPVGVIYGPNGGESRSFHHAAEGILCPLSVR